MAYCSKCGKEVDENAVVCEHCGNKLKEEKFLSSKDGKNIIRFCLTFFLGFIGSYIINHTSLKHNGWKSRTSAYLFLGIITLGIYGLVASLNNFNFDENKPSNIGYFKEF